MSHHPEAPTTSPPSLSERLQSVTEALAAVRTQQDVFRVVLTPALQAVDAVAGAVLLVDQTGQYLTVAATQGHEEGAHTLWQDGPLTSSVPAGDALKRQEALFFEHEGALMRAYPELEAHTDGRAPVATAVLPMILDDRPLGTIILDFKEPHEFTSDEQRFLRTLATQCAIAFGRVRLMTDLERQVQDRAGRALADARAQEAFVAFTEAVGTETDLLALARQAITVLRARFQDSSVGYYTPDGDLWKARAWSEDMEEALVAQLRAGLPSSTPFIRGTLETGTPVFTDTWDPEREQIDHTDAYGASAAYPLIVNGEVRHLLLCGLKGTQRWNDRDRALVRAVGRSLTLAFERAEQTRNVEEERAALDAFARFTERSTHVTDAITLAQEAKDVLLATLGVEVGYSELEDGLWKGRVFSDTTPAEVVAQARKGFPADLPAFARPFQERNVVFVDGWDPQGAEHTEGYGAAALYPYFEDGQPSGLLTMGSPQGRAWTERERTVFRAVGRSLELALERAQQAAVLKQRTMEVQQANEELRRSNAELEQFAYIASHDLQAPVRAVTSFAEVVTERYADVLDERGRTYLGLIMQNGEHMKRLLDDLLTYSRVANERRPLVPTDADAVLDRVLDRLGPQLEALGATVTRAALPMVLADAQQLDGLFQNLLSNALKYHRDGVPPVVEVTAERDGGMWRVTVTDNGIGMEPQYFERIFGMFQRLHGREMYEGTGIGLAVCKKIAERHGGRLWVESRVGEGSTFFFTLSA